MVFFLTLLLKSEIANVRFKGRQNNSLMLALIPGRIQHDRLPGDGMGKLQAAVAQRNISASCLPDFARAVFGIAKDGTPRLGQLGADLVISSRQQLHFQESMAGLSFEHTIR